MLEFNPNKRPTAQEALEDPYFDDIRLPEQERFDTPIINLPVDDEGRSDLPIAELKRMIIDEINKLDSDNFDFATDYGEDILDPEADERAFMTEWRETWERLYWQP